MSTTSETNSNEQFKTDPNSDPEDKIQFGEFLTSQYELLKRTLGYLLIDDLGRAAIVCREWNKAAALILKQRELRSRIRWHVQCRKPRCDHLNCYRNNITFTSQLVLVLNHTKHKPRIMDEISYCKHSSNGYETIMIPGSKGHAFVIDFDRLQIPVSMPDNAFKYSSRESAALFFPRSNRFTIFSTLYTDENSLRETISGENDLRYGPLQGLLIFTQDRVQSLNVVYNYLCHRFQRSVPLAGGMFSAVKNLESGVWNAAPALVLGFHGSIECFSEILSDKRKSAIEPFMKNMRDNLGEIDLSKEQRIAIVIRCMSRPHAKQEDALYQKYFPDIPAFILVSYGEFGNRGDSRKEKEAKILARSETDINYAFSSVYFIVTIQLPPSTT